MKLSHIRVVVGIVALAIGVALLPGCGGDQYPESLKYGLRTDPIVMAGGEKLLGTDRYEPDRPGMLPMMTVNDRFQPHHPYFEKRDAIDDKVLRDPTKIVAAERKELEDALETLFGTPANPVVNAEEAGINPAIIEELQLDPETLKKGSGAYRIHCVHCHGVPGDGRGPTARWINPHPRDFRQGLFKFISVDQTQSTGLPPARSDLMRTLRHGIEGTAMPTFSLLKDEEIETLISYVIHLSIRGTVEFNAITFGFGPQKDEQGNVKLVWAEQVAIPDYAKRSANIAAKRWQRSNDASNAIPVVKYPFADDDWVGFKESVERGHELFTGKPSEKTTKGLADKLFPKLHETAVATAKATKQFEALQKKRDAAKKKNPKLSDEDLDMIELTKQEAAAAELTKKDLADVVNTAQKTAHDAAFNKLKTGCVSCHTDYGRQALYRYDLWGTLVRPNNLSTGNLRGGKRPVDIYYRVHSGIFPSGMPPFATTFAGHENYLWDLVNFVSVLSYPPMRERLGIRID